MKVHSQYVSVYHLSIHLSSRRCALPWHGVLTACSADVRSRAVQMVMRSIHDGIGGDADRRIGLGKHQGAMDALDSGRRPCFKAQKNGPSSEVNTSEDGRFSSHGFPHWWFLDNPIKMEDLGVPPMTTSDNLQSWGIATWDEENLTWSKLSGCSWCRRECTCPAIQFASEKLGICGWPPGPLLNSFSDQELGVRSMVVQW